MVATCAGVGFRLSTIFSLSLFPLVAGGGTPRRRTLSTVRRARESGRRRLSASRPIRSDRRPQRWRGGCQHASLAQRAPSGRAQRGAKLCSPLPLLAVADAVRDSSACQSVSITSRLLHASRILQTPSLTSLLAPPLIKPAIVGPSKVLTKSDPRGLYAHSEPSQESPQSLLTRSSS